MTKSVIGLEIHIELATKSKMFCSCSASHFEVEPNTHCCPVCLGLPGALPVPNKKAIDWTIMLGLALNCEIANESKFDRKNYFYPDLPKGYQISQYDQPLCTNGKVILSSSGKEIGITRVHLEEDTGKLIHTKLDNDSVTLIDFNRSGVALVEVVTEPDFEDSSQVDEFLKKLQLIVRYLEISSADMEKGSMRLEPNISIRTCDVFWTSHVQDRLPPYKVEIKNINSFKFVRKAIDYEISRQQQLLEKGETPVQETMGWNEIESKTISHRKKEGADDYRYFPEPDIPPMTFTKEEIKEIESWIPELPEARIERYVSSYQLSGYNAKLLIENKDLAKYFEEVVACAKNLSPTQIANWLINKKIDINKISPRDLVKTIAESLQTFEIKENDFKIAVSQVLKENPNAVEDFKKGKTAVIDFLLGKVIAKTNPLVDKDLARKKLIEMISG